VNGRRVMNIFRELILYPFGSHGKERARTTRESQDKLSKT